MSEVSRDSSVPQRPPTPRRAMPADWHEADVVAPPQPVAPSPVPPPLPGVAGATFVAPEGLTVSPSPVIPVAPQTHPLAPTPAGAHEASQAEADVATSALPVVEATDDAAQPADAKPAKAKNSGKHSADDKPAKPHGKHRVAKIVLIVGLSVLLALAGTIATLYILINNRMTNINIGGMLGSERPTEVASTSEVKSPGDPYAGRAMNILVMGSDSREGANSQVSQDADPGGERADTTFIAHVSADRSRVDLVSIPRDTLVVIPTCYFENGKRVPYTGGSGTQKFNAAFAWGKRTADGTIGSGVACAIKTVEKATNVHIDGFVYVDFMGFAKIVDAVGGVDLFLPCAVKSHLADNLNLPAGVNHMNGLTATNYARARHGTGLGDQSDLSRIKRQQALMLALATKVLGMNLITDLGSLYNFVGSVADAITTDLGSVAGLAGFAYSLRHLPPGALTFTMTPVGGAGDGSSVIFIQSKVKPIFEALRNDKPIPGTNPETNPGVNPETPGGTPGPTPTTAPTTAQPTLTPSKGPTGPTPPPGVISAPLGQC